MSEIKVRLSLSVPGAQRISWEEAQKYPMDSYDITRIKVEGDKKGRQNRETLIVRTLKNRLVKQSISISQEAYDYMVNEIPSDADVKEKRAWKTYSKKQRLNHHFNKIAEHLGAVGYSFEILDD